MGRSTKACAMVGVVLAIVGAVAPSRAAHHLWSISQVYSNASGSVQFVQLHCPEAGENSIGPFGVSSHSKSFSFVNNLPPNSTANSWILIATPGFAGLPGAIAPDYVLPSGNFFSTGGDTLNYASGTDSWTFGMVPTDGVHSLMRDGTTPQNSLMNFTGGTGSLTLQSSAAAPALPRAGIAVVVGALLLAGSGLLKKRVTPAA
jgi:hypothetical protein